MYLCSIIKDSRFCFGDGVLFISGEKNKFVNILSKSFFVSIEGLLASIFTSVIDGNTNRSGKLNSQSSSFNFIQSESSAESKSVIISDGGTVDGGSEIINGSRSIGGSFGSSGLKSSFLSSSLVQPGSDVSLPVFSEMDVGDHVVVLNHKSQIILIFN